MAESYARRQPAGTCRVVGLQSSETPVPLEAFVDYRLVFRSRGAESWPVKIFEYRGLPEMALR